MASIHKKSATSWGVSYTYTDEDGKTRNKQETFKTEEDAIARGREVDYLKKKGTFTPPSDKTVDKLLKDFVNIYGANNWSCSTYATNTGMINNYVLPHIGKVKLKHLNTKKMDEYFIELQDLPRVPTAGQPDRGLVTNRMIKEIHVMLTTAFNLAVAWGDISKNPISMSSRPIVKKKIKAVLDPGQTKHLVSHCEDLRLLACIYLAIGCSMRIGEILGLRWNNVSFGDEQNNFENAKVEVVEELQRVTLDALSNIKSRKEDIHFTFPTIKKSSKSRLVLKEPKTESSVRTVWIPEIVCYVLQNIKTEQARHKKILGDDYEDYNLVISRTNGRPLEEKRINELFDETLEKADLHKVVFHSLRHTSTTIKLLITKGDIKSVQGDTGHADSRMVTNTYSFIIDKNRKKTAKLVNNYFEGEEEDLCQNPNNSNIDKLIKILSDKPEMVDKLLSSLQS